MMNATTKQHDWTKFLKLFCEQNNNRRTRLGVFEKTADGGTTDYWVEEGLPLRGIDVDAHGEDKPTIEIMLGDAAENGSPHLTHTVNDARTVKIVLSAGAEADGLEIEDSTGKTTVLRFEN